MPERLGVSGRVGLRVAVLVSADPSDLYFLNQAFRKLPVVGGVVERPGQTPPSRRRRASRLALLGHPRLLVEKIQNHWFWTRHHARCREIDRAYFGDDAFRVDPAFAECVLDLGPGEPLNGARVIDHLTSLAPDVVLTCGCSLLGAELLEIPARGVLNLHGGLSQRYRGLWTTLWAVYNGEPEWVGCTVHFVAPGIDDGPIVAQGRPEVSPGDDPETLYAKVVCQGVDLVVQAVETMGRRVLQGRVPRNLGPVYLGRQVTPEVIREAWRRARSGVISDYLADKSNRDAPVLATMDEERTP